MEKEEIKIWKDKIECEQEGTSHDSEAPQLVVQQFSMEALHHTMIRNKSQILGMYDEMSVMYGQLDAYKHQGSRLDRSTLLDLYNGGSWSRNFKNKVQATCKMQETAFNMCGFIQPSFVVSMLESCDPDAFNDRQFFICPAEVEYCYSELKVPIDPDIPKLDVVFKLIKNNHQHCAVYSFSSEAQSYFIKIHDELCDRKRSIIDDEDRRGILSKAKGQLARLSMIIHCLQQALIITATDSPWTLTISKKSVEEAKTVLEYVIEQKFALMQPEIKIDVMNSGSEILDESPKHLSKFLCFNGNEIMASDVSKYRLMPPIETTKKNKYPVEKCREYMRRVSDAGFGTLINDSGSFRSLTFRKRPYSELGSQQQEAIKKMNISEELYHNSFLEHSADASNIDDICILESQETSDDGSQSSQNY